MIIFYNIGHDSVALKLYFALKTQKDKWLTRAQSTIASRHY